MRYHAFCVKGGNVKLLCNGRPVISKTGEARNTYRGDPHLLVEAMKSTEGTKHRIAVPQEYLRHKVTCEKCCRLINPKVKARYMKSIYKNSDLYKNRKGSRSVDRLKYLGDPDNVQLAGPSKWALPRTLELPKESLKIPFGKTLLLSIQVV